MVVDRGCGCETNDVVVPVVRMFRCLPNSVMIPNINVVML